MNSQALTALALGLALVMIPQARGGERDTALAAIKQLGGRVEVEEDKPDKPVRLIYLWGERVTDKELALLKALPDLRRLDLRDAKITDEGLRLLGQMPQLEALYLWNTPITDARSAERRVGKACKSHDV